MFLKFTMIMETLGDSESYQISTLARFAGIAHSPIENDYSCRIGAPCARVGGLNFVFLVGSPKVATTSSRIGPQGALPTAERFPTAVYDQLPISSIIFPESCGYSRIPSTMR